MVGLIVDTSGHKRISTKTHTIFDGRVQVYRRAGGHHWQCATRVGGRRFRASTHEEALDRAKDVAEEWYLDLRGKLRAGVIDKVERTFAEAAKGYLAEVAVLAATTRSPVYVQLLTLRMNKHLLPYFGKMPLKDINRGAVQAYRVQRSKDAIERTAREGQPGSRRHGAASRKRSYTSGRRSNGPRAWAGSPSCRTCPSRT